MNEPSEIIAGFQYSWEESLTDYPADDGWTLKYKGLNASGKIEITADADGSGYSITLTPTITAAYTAGTYTFYKYVEHSDGTKYQISTYTVDVLANPITANTLDTRTHARKMFEALEALELGRATKPQKSFQIAGRAIEYLSPEEIIKWKNHYKIIMNAEEGVNPTRKRLATFSRDPFQ
mgnify:FL=1